MTDHDWEETRRKVLGLGEKSQQKSYFPALKRRLKEHEQLRLALDSSSDAIFWVELPDWRLLDMNAAAKRMTGYNLGSSSGLLKQHFPKDAWHQIQQLADSGWKEGTGKLVTELIHSYRSNTPVELSVDAVDTGRQRLAIVVARDITERRMLEAQLQQAQKLEAIGVLAGGIAHDFNNVLFVILGNADMAEALLSEEEVNKNLGDLENCISEILTAGRRGADLVKQILTFARKTERVRQPVDILPVVKESIKMMRSIIPSSISIAFEADVNDAWIIADPTEIHQILMNLCTNASQAIPEDGGTLSISIADIAGSDLPTDMEALNDVKERYACITVSDTGVGIPNGILSRIFEPFFSTKAIGKGTGMGLSVVHGIITSLDGRITVESKPGVGTVFRIYLPVVAGKNAEQVVGSHDLPTGTEHILVVDDEHTIMSMLKKVIGGLGYAVTPTNSSEEALELFRKDPDEYDLLLTDQTMPGISGIELVRQVHEVRADLPVVLCTGYSHMVGKANAIEFGITEFVLKPLDRESLALSIRRALDQVHLAESR